MARFLGVKLDYLLNMPEENDKELQNKELLEMNNKLRHFSQSDLAAVHSVINAINEKY